MDATRIADGKFVLLKCFQKSVYPYEAEISMFLSSPPLANDPKNHCAPVYEALQVPDDDDKTIIVMPLLRKYRDPRFDTIGEVVEFFTQIFEVRVSGSSRDASLKGFSLGVTLHAQTPRSTSVCRQPPPVSTISNVRQGLYGS
jgi:hypothetical protein